MARYLMLLVLIVSPALFVGCGKSELAPDDSQVPEVDPADIQKEIQRGMQQSGEVRQPDYNPGK